MTAKINTTTKREVIEVLTKLQDAIDKNMASMIDEDTTTDRQADHLEALAIRAYDDIKRVMGWVEEYEVEIFYHPTEPAA